MATGTNVNIDHIHLGAGKTIKGGGLMTYGTTTINASTIAHVTATMTTGSLSINGGAAAFLSGKSVVSNTTIGQNTAQGTGITHATSILVGANTSFINDTFVNDAAQSTTFLARPSGKAVTGGFVVSGGVASVENSILDTTATNTNANNCLVTTTTTPTAQLLSIGGNIDSGSSCGLDSYTDKSTTTPKVGSFGTHNTNGNSTLHLTTFGIQTGSPAIGGGILPGAPEYDEVWAKRDMTFITVGALQYFTNGGTGGGTTTGTTTGGGTSGGTNPPVIDAITYTQGPTIGDANVVLYCSTLISRTFAVTWNGVTLTKSTSKTYGTYTVDFATQEVFITTPVSTAGTVGVSVSDANGNSNTVTYTYFVPSTTGYTEVGAQGAWSRYEGGHLTVASPSPTVIVTPSVVAAATYPGGVIETTANGFIYDKAYAPTFGNAAALHLNAPIVGIASTLRTGLGYYLVASDGGVFAYGAAEFYGSMGGQHLNAPIVGMTVTPTNHGYYLVASDGGIFAFGTAHYRFYGSMGSDHLNKPIVGMAEAPTGHGYWLVASDGGVFNFGSAHFYGSMAPVVLHAPIVGMMSTTTGLGYWLVGSDGGIFALGEAEYQGSVNQGQTYAPTVAVVATSAAG
jgi:hypothetical protein